MERCDNQYSRKVIMAEEKEREVKNAAKDLVKTQRRAARFNFNFFCLNFINFLLQGSQEKGEDFAQDGFDRGGGDE